MSMRINEPRKNYVSGAINLLNFAFIFSQPGIAEHVALRSCSGNSSSRAKHRRIADYSDFFKRCSTAWAVLPAQSEQLADIRQQEVRGWLCGWQEQSNLP